MAFCLLFRHGKRRSPPGTRAVRTKNYLWRRNWEHFETARRVVAPYSKSETVPELSLGAGHRSTREKRTVHMTRAVPLIRPLRGYLPLKGKACGRPKAAPTEHTKDCLGNIVGAGPRPARQVWGNSRDTAGGAHPRVASLGLRPIHLQPLPYKITGTFPNLRWGAPWGSRQDSQR